MAYNSNTMRHSVLIKDVGRSLCMVLLIIPCLAAYMYIQSFIIIFSMFFGTSIPNNLMKCFFTLVSLYVVSMCTEYAYIVDAGAIYIAHE